MLRIILKRLKKKAEEILLEEQAGFGPERSTTDQIFNIRLLTEKHLHHQHALHHNSAYWVCHEGLWQVLRNYNSDTSCVSSPGSIQCFPMKDEAGGRHMQPPFWWQYWPYGKKQKRTLGTNNQAGEDNWDMEMEGSSQQPQSANTNQLQDKWARTGRGEGKKYHGLFVCNEGIKSIKARLCIVTSTTTRLISIRWINIISFPVKIKLYKVASLVYRCKSWALVDTECRIQA